MPPKKNKPNPFYYFMLEKQKELEKRSQKKISLAELPELVHKEWKELPDEEKDRFRKMCVNSNKQKKERYDSRGLPISQLEKQMEAERTQHDEMIASIKRTVRMLHDSNAIPNATFSVICISHYICKEDGTYIPAEIGLCHFSLAKGILSHYHKILPADIPLGFKFEALQHSNETHNLLLKQQFQVGEFKKEIREFLTKNGNQVPIVYSQNEYLTSIGSIFKSWKWHSSVKLYSLDSLFKYLYSASILELPESIATEMLTSCIFDYSPSAPCIWHQEFAPDAGHFCALGIARRWIFNICDSFHLLETFGIHPQKGHHLPEDSVDNVCNNIETLTLHSPKSPISPKPNSTQNPLPKPSSTVGELLAQRKRLLSSSSLAKVGGETSFQNDDSNCLKENNEPNKDECKRTPQFKLSGFGRGRRNLDL